MATSPVPEIRLAAQTGEREKALALRHRVFCDEQGVAVDLELDGRDGQALHLVAVSGGRVVGTCRLVLDGSTAKLGRLAVEPGERGRGLGARLLARAEEQAREAGAARISLHAQLAARGLYERGGFAPVGRPFDEAGIEHVLMEKWLA